jgi:cysteinyl-tRNA synthetase
MIRLDQTKMSKSVGNIFLLHQALDAFGRDALLMYFCGSDYRKPVEFDEERLTEAQARVERIGEAARRLTAAPSPEWSAPLRERFFDALADDFKTPAALAAVFDWVRESNRAPGPSGDADLREMLSVLGLDNLLDVAPAEAPAEVVELRDAREHARAARDYAEADRLREEIRARGWEVRDGPDGPELLPAA